MRPADNIERKIVEKLHFKADVKMHDRILNEVLKAQDQYKKTKTAKAVPNVWRTIMKSGVTKVAVAAAIIIAFGIGFSIGQRSKPTQLAIYSLDVSGYTPAVPGYPTAPKAEGSFWRQKILAAMQPRPYAQTLNTKISLFDAYKQYLKGETL